MCGVSKRGRPRGARAFERALEKGSGVRHFFLWAAERARGGEGPSLIELVTMLGVVVAYGRILPDSLLAIPRLGMINVHASLLPRLRGAAPIQHALIEGLDETGVSIMQLDEGMDTGPVLLRVATPIAPGSWRSRRS